MHGATTGWRRAVVAAATAAGLVAGLLLAPHRICAREAGRVYAGEVGLERALAAGVASRMAAGVDERGFATGHALFDREWAFGTLAMAGMGFAQVAIEHPETAAENRPRVAACVDRLLSADMRRFDADAWSADPIDSLAGGEGHAAYLGYLSVVLALERLVDPATPHARVGDAIDAALVRRVRASPTLLLETYPGQVFPVDNAAVVASIALHARARAEPPPALLARWSERCRARFLDPATGLLVQRVTPSGAPADAPRGSGTALAAYFLSFADPALSRDLHRAVQRSLAGSVIGFGAVLEYPPSWPGGRGDIDSGPILLGYGVSATGFAIAGCRIHRDERCFRSLWATASLAGAPVERDGARRFALGGPLGDAILFAMATALPVPEAAR